MNYDLCFKEVDPVKFSSNATTATAAGLVAIIRLHNELPKNEQGVATFTIRTLIKEFTPGVTGLLREYVCAFGAHGEAVIVRTVEREGADMEAFEAEVNAKLTAYRGAVHALESKSQT